jgi:hypothetical protein
VRVFLDNSVPEGVRRYLKRHQVLTAANQRWERLENGDLINAVESAGFDVLVTADQNIEYQQNLTRRKISLVVLGSNNWPIVRSHISEVVAFIEAALPNSFAFIKMPLPPKPEYKPREKTPPDD